MIFNGTNEDYVAWKVYRELEWGWGGTRFRASATDITAGCKNDFLRCDRLKTACCTFQILNPLVKPVLYGI